MIDVEGETAGIHKMSKRSNGVPSDAVLQLVLTHARLRTLSNVSACAFSTGQCGSWRADVFPLLPSNCWQADHHHYKSKEFKGNGHNRSIRWDILKFRLPPVART